MTPPPPAQSLGPETLDLGYISGGEQPPNFTFMGKTWCEPCQPGHGRDPEWLKQHM